MVTKKIHKNLPRGGGGGEGVVGLGSRGVGDVRVGMVGSRGWWSGISRCHSIDLLPKLWLLDLGIH